MDFSSLSGSPGFAGMFSSSPGVPGTPSPKKAVEKPSEVTKRERNGVLPLTVKQYLSGTETFVEGQMSMYGLPTPKVSIVGLVEKVEKSPACHEYTVNDFSGRVTVQSYSPDSLADNPAEGDMVRVVGEPREGGLLSAINVTVQKDQAVLGYHRLQAVLALCNASQVVPLNYETPGQPLSGTELITQIKVACKRRKVVVPA